MAESNEQIDFVWKGKDKQGKVIKGELAALNTMVAKAELRRQSIRVITIKKKPKPLFSKAKSVITTKDISVFARQLATMLESGVPLVQSFDIIGKGHENPAMAEMEKVCVNRYEMFNCAGQGSKIKGVSLNEMANRYESGSLDPIVG